VGAPPDPYAVWISEIMLQQTRVETAIPFYLRFLARFPDVASLAEAEEAEVLALWSGLGYYRRCRGLLAAAKAIVAGGGKLPASARELERLPGVGPYTAAAIASIAFSERIPVLDGNVERVLCRFAALRAGQKSSQGRSALLQLAARLLDPLRPGDSNQALMELGATVCTPRAPDCPACPLGDDCKARALGAAESFPARVRRTPGKRVPQLLAFVERDRRLLLYRRSGAAGQLAGLWEFPLVERSAETAPETLLASRYPGSWVLGAPIARLRHAITTSTFDIEVRRASFRAHDDIVCEPAAGSDGSAGSDPSEAGWWDIAAVGELALTGVARKVLARAGIQPG
jgi:A/G-specific adenine glycosylase